jgi:hypothetical protein
VYAWIAPKEVGDLEMAERLTIVIHAENLGNHLSYTPVRWRMSAKILIYYPINKKLLLFRSQSLLLLMSYRVALLTCSAVAQRRFRYIVRPTSLSLARKNASIKISDSRLYKELAISHIKCVVEIAIVVGCAESIVRGKYSAQLIQLDALLQPLYHQCFAAQNTLSTIMMSITSLQLSTRP